MRIEIVRFAASGLPPSAPHINGGKASPRIRIDIETRTESRFRLPWLPSLMRRGGALMLRSRWQRLPFSRSGGKGPGDGGCSRKTYLYLLRVVVEARRRLARCAYLLSTWGRYPRLQPRSQAGYPRRRACRPRGGFLRPRWYAHPPRAGRDARSILAGSRLAAVG